MGRFEIVREVAVPAEPPQSWLPSCVVPMLSQYSETPVPGDQTNVTVPAPSVVPGTGLVNCAMPEGAVVGVAVGRGVGVEVGAGVAVGDAVGPAVGVAVGAVVDSGVGVTVGTGVFVGRGVGAGVGVLPVL